MAHQLIAIKNNKQNDITELVGSLAWSSNIDTLGQELSFEYANNSILSLDKGDLIILYSDNIVLHHYIIVSESVSDRFKRSFTCFDYAWWLNKNQTIIQFSKISVTSAIQKLCDRFNVKHNIANIPTLITKIYKGDTVSDIIMDVLEQAKQETGSVYRLEMVNDTLTIRKQTDLLINPTIRLSGNSPLSPVSDFISNPSHTSSIDELKNKVIVHSEGENDTYKIQAEATDDVNVSKYGLLTAVVSVDDKNLAQSRNIAKNTLAELNQISHDISLSMLGHDDIVAGRLIDINEPVTGIVGRFVIKSANHTVSNGLHYVSVNLGVT